MPFSPCDHRPIAPICIRTQTPCVNFSTIPRRIQVARSRDRPEGVSNEKRDLWNPN
jgi:hypothetical protein